jgi:hypothetical protein
MANHAICLPQQDSWFVKKAKFEAQYAHVFGFGDCSLQHTHVELIKNSSVMCQELNRNKSKSKNKSEIRHQLKVLESVDVFLGGKKCPDS